MINNLNSFLCLGYFLNYKNKENLLNTIEINKEKYKHVVEEELIDIGSKLWKKAISSHFEKNQKHLIPLSGGLDSRAILAALLEHTEASNLYTYTFGTPNALDYDIGSYLGKKFGTNHTSFDLTKYIYTQGELEDISKRVDLQTILFHHAPIWEVDKMFSDCIAWSGVMGGSSSGGALFATPSKTLENAKKQFLKRNTYVRSIDLASSDKFHDLIDCNPPTNEGQLTLDEEIDYGNRQSKFIMPHVLIKGYPYKTPFLHSPWVNFMLSVSEYYRINQKLYKKILLSTFPKQFKYKTKANSGLPLNASSFTILSNRVNNKLFRMMGISTGKNINYLDFNEQIRNKSDLQKVISSNILDLKSRRLIGWIDIESILKKHLARKANFADALIVLASLEIHLKNGLIL